MSHARKQSPATYAELCALPEHMVGEIVFGVLHAHPRPAPRHARASTRLGAELDGPFDRGRGGPGGWIILDEPELHFGEDVIVPDLAGWRRERMPRLPETAWFETAPDWVCEVLSPSTIRFDRSQKLIVYATAGVRHCWLVDPIARTLEAYALSDGKWLLLRTFADAEPIAIAPFEAHTFPLDVLWPEETA